MDENDRTVVTVTPKRLASRLADVGLEMLAKAYAQHHNVGLEHARAAVADLQDQVTRDIEAQIRETMDAMLVPVETKDNQSDTL